MYSHLYGVSNGMPVVLHKMLVNSSSAPCRSRNAVMLGLTGNWYLKQLQSQTHRPPGFLYPFEK